MYHPGYHSEGTDRVSSLNKRKWRQSKIERYRRTTCAIKHESSEFMFLAKFKWIDIRHLLLAVLK